MNKPKNLFQILGIALKKQKLNPDRKIESCKEDGPLTVSEMLLTQKEVNEYNARKIQPGETASEYLVGYEARTEWAGEKKTGEIILVAASDDKARDTMVNYFGLSGVLEYEIKYVKLKGV